MNTLKFGNGEWYGKKDTILAYNDENSNFKPLPFSFDRASSATRVNKDGLIETVGSGEPRIDYKDDSKGALLLEPSRSNLFTYSEDFTQDWISGGGGAFTITPNAVVSPDNTQNASKLIASGVGHQLRQNKAIINTQMSNSFYMRTNQGTRQMSIRINDNEITQTFTVTSEWKRYTVSGLVGGTLNGSGRCSLNNVDVLDENNHVYVWGAQLEQGSYATSYIPTQGSIGTRSKPIVSSSDLSAKGIINSTEGTYFIDIKFPSMPTRDASTGGFVLGSDNSFPSPQGLEIATDLDGSLRIGKRDGSFTQIFDTTNGVYHKIAFKWDLLNVKLFVDGTLEYTGTYSSTPFKYLYSDTGDGSKIIKDIKLYNTALTDQELINLTTI